MSKVHKDGKKESSYEINEKKEKNQIKSSLNKLINEQIENKTDFQWYITSNSI